MPESILFPTGKPSVPGVPTEATADLRLDQIFEKMAMSRDGYELRPVFYTPLTDSSAVRFRQAIFKDIDTNGLRPAINEFAEGMLGVRNLLAGITKLTSPPQQQAWFLDAADRYCETLEQFASQLRAASDIRSAGLRQVIDYLEALSISESHTRLRDETARTLVALHAIRYRLTVIENRIIVESYEGETDYSEQVLATFDRFRQREITPPEPRSPKATYMNHVDGSVLNLVARLHPSEFTALAEFCDSHKTFIDDTVASFDQELQFYTAVIDLLAPLQAAGLPVCYPDVADEDPTVDAHDVYDVALADNLVAEQRPVVLNDLSLIDGERIIVVTGPNQGGKTTFARTFGQLHHLAALGAPIPGSQVRIGLFDRIFSHFERTEDLRNLSGKLEEELVRIHTVIEQATSHSIVVMNESFGSTSVNDARLLGTSTIEKLIQLDLRAIYVTFVDELSRVGPSIVSMVSTVVPDDPNQRTFKILRRPADGRAYAMVLAERHGLTARQLKERIGA